MSELERIVNIMQAYDGRPQCAEAYPEWRTPEMKPGANYGIVDCQLRMILKGPLGAVQFVVSTGWYPPHVYYDEQLRWGVVTTRPLGVDVGYHSPVPRYEGQEAMAGPGECPYVPEGKPCYYDGSGLLADEWVHDILLRKGSDGIWEALEAEYRRLFVEGSDEL